METDNLLYYKRGRKYIPVGVCYTPDYVGPGLWYCDIKPGCRSTTNADQYIGHLLKVSDVEMPILKQCQLHKVADEVLRRFDFKHPYSVQEVIEWAVGETFKVCNHNG